MTSLKRFLGLVALILMITLACFMPVPLTVYRKDKLPSHQIEQIDQKKDNEDDEDAKDLFG